MAMIACSVRVEEFVSVVGLFCLFLSAMPGISWLQSFFVFYWIQLFCFSFSQLVPMGCVLVYLLKGNRCTKIVYSKYGYSVETNWIAMSEGGHIWSQSPTFQFPTFYCDNKSDCTVLQKYWPVLSKCVRCYKRSWPSGPVQAKLLQEKLTCRSSLDQKDRKVNFSCSNSRIWRGPASILGGPDSHFYYDSKT